MSKGESTLPALPTGLTRHKNGTYYLRRRIPADLLSFYDGKKEIGESLNTKNYKDAVERFYVRDAQIKLIGGRSVSGLWTYKLLVSCAD